MQNSEFAKTPSVHHSTRHREVKIQKKKKKKNLHGPYSFPSRHSAASQKADILMILAAPTLKSMCMLWGMTDLRSTAALQRLRLQQNKAALSATAALAARRQPFRGTNSTKEKKKRKTFSRSRIVNYIRA